MIAVFIILIPAYGLYRIPNKFKNLFFFTIFTNLTTIYVEENIYRCGALPLMDYIRNRDDI